ncbi:family 1 glycosylhydrolase [Micromonospora sp. DT81.3]|uniref:family 1 glycosylhydrolase n=1 Tax=Micromonospora sp. DT81.3 TaxID=3416523 RepID=UPI003CEF9672
MGDSWHRQFARSGHYERLEQDLEACASLGVTGLRYPVLWEEVESPSGERDFTYADRAMRYLEQSPMTPIVGLLHHGSGPSSTSLDDPQLPERLGDFAEEVACRYPWVSDWTPVNEPLTTARFSGLYGHWYPHANDDPAFVAMLLNEVKATILAMRAIRRMNPDARLIQTEDFGRTGGTRPLRDQIAFDNERRWLTFDLLSGRVDRRHPLYGYLTGMGAADPAELQWIAANACPPDILGLNHYPRSNRWLDHRLDQFHPAFHGGNGRKRYADVAACDTHLASQPSLLSLIDEAWRRYETPIAITEVHIYDHFEGQAAWWRAALAAAEVAAHRGIPVAGVTVWSLLGSFDWDTLCTTEGDEVTYEPGVFEVHNGERLETPLAEAVRDAAYAVDRDRPHIPWLGSDLPIPSSARGIADEAAA